MSKVAPDSCPIRDCGSPAYFPFSGGAKCTRTDCDNFDNELWLEWLDEELGGEEFNIETEAPTDVFREFCQSCHQSADFERWTYEDGRMGAWCPHCGLPNYWDGKPVLVPC